MLTSEAEISEVGGGVADEDDNDDRDVGGAVSHSRIIDFNRRAFKRDFVEAKLKQVIMFPFAKSNKKKQTRTQLSSFSSSGKRVDAGGGVCGGFCCTQPRTLESPADSKTFDPNHPTFTHEMLKALIENNHFYSKECNPHSHSV